MTLGGLILRFAIAYFLSLMVGTWLAVFFVNKSAMVIGTAALAASTLYVCQLFFRRNGRLFRRRETLLVWLAFLAIDAVLQVVSAVSFVGTVDANLLRLRQYAVGGLPFTLLFHGVCIYLFMWIAGKTSAKKLGL